MKKKTILLLVALFGMNLAWGQCPARYFEYLDVNQVNARINNSADMFWDLSSSPQYEVPVGSGKHAAFSSSLWIGGLDASGDLHLAAETYRQSGVDFFPGPYRSTGNYDCTDFYQPTNSPTQVLGLSNGEAWFIGSNGVEAYDPATGNFQILAFPAARTYAQGLELADGRVLIYGDASIQQPVPLFLIDPVTFTMTTSATLSNWQAHSSAIQLNNGQVLIAGVMGSDLFDPATGTASTTGALNLGRARAAISLLPIGNALLTGGNTSLSGGSGLTEVEIYDAGAGTWSTGPALSVGRRDHQMTFLNSGEVCITGGNAGSGAVDHYDPVTNSMTLGATIDPLFVEHTATLNSSGDVVITTNDQSQPANNFFAYTPGQNQVTQGQVYGVGPVGAQMSTGGLMTADGSGNFSQVDINTLGLVGQPWQHIWKINQSEIDQFLIDFQTGNVNFANYPVIQEWPAHGNVSLGEDHYQAPFVDVNMDGWYNPATDGDYPCIEGDQALWWTYNDAANVHTGSGADALGIQVKTMAYAYNCNLTNCPPGLDALDETTFYHYEIKNHGGQDYSDVYIALWMDADIGNFSDDYVGCDTNRSLGYAFNGNVIDAGASGYGSNPPALGTMVLSTPDVPNMSNYMYYQNDFSVRGNPEISDHYYDYMRSIWKDGSHLTSGGNGYGGTTNTNFMYSGDPGYCGGAASGWNEVGEGNLPFDRRYLQSFGPFDFPADSTIKFDVAVLYARGYYNDNLGSVCELQSAADSIQDWFTGLQHSCFSIILDSEEPIERKGNLLVYPNPGSSFFNIELEKASRRGGEVRVLDQFGRVVKQRSWQAGTQKMRLDVSDLSKGVYILGLKVEGELITQKLVIQ